MGIKHAQLTLVAMNKLNHLSFAVLLMGLLLVVLGPLIQFRSVLPLACPEWPLCFGQSSPDALHAQRAWIEISHRALATLVGLGSLLLLSLVYKHKSETTPELRKAAAYALFFVVLQGALGGLTVIYRLPMVISTLHMIFSLIFLFYQVKLCVLTKNKTLKPEETWFIKKHWSSAWRDSLWITATLMVGLVVLGSFVRQTGSLPACGTGLTSLWSCSSLWVDEVSGRAHLHLFFRFWASLVLVSLIAGFVSKAIWWWRHREDHKSKTFFAPYVFWGFLGIGQFFAGLMVLVTHLSMVSSIIYLALSMSFLLLNWFLALEYSALSSHIDSRRTHTIASDLLELTKPKLSALVIVTAAVGIILAPQPMGLLKAILALFLISLVVMGACALNCVIEKDVDKKMLRTQDRSLPAGRLSSSLATIFGVTLLVISLPLLGFAINWLTASLAGLAALLYLYAYTPLKQHSELALFVGAIPGALPPVMGWTASMNSLDPMAYSLFIIMFIWQLPHFLAISIFHAEDYGKAGIVVYPNRKGFEYTKNGIFIYTIVLLLVGLLPYWWAGSSRVFFFVSLILSLLFLAVAAAGLNIPENSDRQRAWARRYFLGSIFYLPMIMGSMIVFK
jgi:heme o synthase